MKGARGSYWAKSSDLSLRRKCFFLRREAPERLKISVPKRLRRWKISGTKHLEANLRQCVRREAPHTGAILCARCLLEGETPETVDTNKISGVDFIFELSDHDIKKYLNDSKFLFRRIFLHKSFHRQISFAFGFQSR